MAADQDGGKILWKTIYFQTKQVSAEKEEEKGLMHYLEEAQHVQKVSSRVKYGLRMSPVLSDIVAKAHKMW